LKKKQKKNEEKPNENEVERDDGPADEIVSCLVRIPVTATV